MTETAPTPKRDRARERLVVVAVAESALTAQVLQDTLADAGIRSMTRNRDAAAITLGGLGGLPFSVEVLVLEGDADAANALLGPPPREQLPPPGLPTAPKRRRRFGPRRARD